MTSADPLPAAYSGHVGGDSDDDFPLDTGTDRADPVSGTEPEFRLEQLLEAGIEVRNHRGSDLGPMRVATLAAPHTRDTMTVFEHYEQGPAPGCYLLSMWEPAPTHARITDWLSSLLPRPLHLVWLNPNGTTQDEQWLPDTHETPTQTRAAPRRRTTKAAMPQDIRAWAKANGYEVAPQGHIPSQVQDAFKANQTHRERETG